PRGQPFALVVGQHFLKCVGEKSGAVAGPTAAEEVEWEEDRAGFHGAACHEPKRYNTIKLWEGRSVFRTEATKVIHHAGHPGLLHRSRCRGTRRRRALARREHLVRGRDSGRHRPHYAGA